MRGATATDNSPVLGAASDILPVPALTRPSSLFNARLASGTAVCTWVGMSTAGAVAVVVSGCGVATNVRMELRLVDSAWRCPRKVVTRKSGEVGARHTEQTRSEVSWRLSNSLDTLRKPLHAFPVREQSKRSAPLPTQGARIALHIRSAILAEKKASHHGGVQRSARTAKTHNVGRHDILGPSHAQAPQRDSDTPCDTAQRGTASHRWCSGWSTSGKKCGQRRGAAAGALVAGGAERVQVHAMRRRGVRAGRTGLVLRE